MKKTVFFSIFLSYMSVIGQTSSFDNLNANPLTEKAITWKSSNYGQGFGHRIINSDPRGKTLLNFQGRHNSTTWVDIMSITSNGNIGIGTTTPNAKLQIEGKTKVGNQGILTLDWTHQTNWGGSSNNWAGYIGFNAHRENDEAKDFYKGTNRYTSKGVFEGSNHGFRWLYRNQINHDSNEPHELSEYMRLTNTGNLGIGTTKPDAKLQVEGKTKVGNQGILTLDWTHQTNWGGSSNNWAGYIGFNAHRENDEAKDFYKGTNRYTSKGVFEGSNHGFRWLYRNHVNYDSNVPHELSEYMRLTNAGNLGIGTTTPDAKLTVKGNIHTQEVKVDLNGAVAPDYVFKEEYKLKSLKEVEDYIKKKGTYPTSPLRQKWRKRESTLKK